MVTAAYPGIGCFRCRIESVWSCYDIQLVFRLEYNHLEQPSHQQQDTRQLGLVLNASTHNPKHVSSNEEWA